MCRTLGELSLRTAISAPRKKVGLEVEGGEVHREGPSCSFS